MIFDVKQAIIDRLRATKRRNIETVIDYMKKHRFFRVECGSHHKYPGGLASHAWQTYQVALRLYEVSRTMNPDTPIVDVDSIAIAALLHDFCKCSGMTDEVKGKHGQRSTEMLKTLGFHLPIREFLAIRFHMDQYKKHFLFDIYKEPQDWQLRELINEADHISADLYKGYDDPVKRKRLQYYLQNITELDSRSIIFQTEDGWYLNLHSSFDGDINLEWKSKIINVKMYESAELIGINDSSIGAIYILGAEGRKALFINIEFDGLQGRYFSYDRDPFIYSEVKVYFDWTKWDNYGYAVCKQENGWKLVKIIQFPMPEYKIIGEGFTSPEKAMKSIGIDDCDKYLYNGMI